MSVKPLRHRSNDITSGLLHVIGVGLAVAVLVVLLVLGARHTAWHVVGYSLYGSGLILLYIASSAYHLTPHRYTRLKGFFRRFDHGVIYLFIAATYTPITFIALAGGWRWTLFGIIWGLAVCGFVMKMMSLRIPAFLGTALYLCMGWFILIAYVPLRHTLTITTIWLFLCGGISYTVGVIFFVLETKLKQRKYFWMHEVFHLCVLGGSALHAICMFCILSVELPSL
jgi:hemolysin III